MKQEHRLTLNLWNCHTIFAISRLQARPQEIAKLRIRYSPGGLLAP